MKAIVALDGQIQLADVPVPQLDDRSVLVQTEYSAISPGTELMMQDVNRHKEVALGYSASGIVKQVGKEVTHLQVGQRVACYGAPYVKHAEMLTVPRHLAVPVPDHVTLVEASTVGLGAIAIHALRQASLQFGESVVVVGLGILGQIIAQIAAAAGLNVIALDIVEERCAAAEKIGLQHICQSPEEVQAKLETSLTEQGADCVILAGGKGGELVDQGLQWIRDRGKVVVVGDLQMEFSRELMFAKEAQLLISRAGGPGRYDATYESGGIDYPIGYVRWTEGKNMAEFIRLMAEGLIHISPLISKVMPLAEAEQAYHVFRDNPRDTLGIVLQY
ncbi:zinc-binding alcohol dehydrogenase [Paenibacillus sp. GCM10027626]|uniref:zinc-dependent alcohol dehydrogenase n=1 Tax=Paenibacillus sp. GCM10027626 TaxID=3273411 RepID=UPI0036376949